MTHYQPKQIQNFKQNSDVTYDYINFCNPYINKLWNLSLDSKSLHEHIIIPDACCDLIVDVHSKEVFICPAHSLVQVIDLDGPFEYFGISFQPGMIGLFTDLQLNYSYDFVEIESHCELSKMILEIYICNKNNCKTGIKEILEKYRKRDISRGTYCERHSRRITLQKYGLSPKKLEKIYRLQKTFQLLSSFDYYDQSHYIKEFKILTGYTPTQFYKKYSL